MFMEEMIDFRFKVVFADGGHTFEYKQFFSFAEAFNYAYDSVFVCDIKQIDIYTDDNDRLIATFYH